MSTLKDVLDTKVTELKCKYNDHCKRIKTKINKFKDDLNVKDENNIRVDTKREAIESILDKLVIYHDMISQLFIEDIDVFQSETLEELKQINDVIAFHKHEFSPNKLYLIIDTTNTNANIDIYEL